MLPEILRLQVAAKDGLPRDNGSMRTMVIEAAPGGLNGGEAGLG